jgi:hypothetical protein
MILVRVRDDDAQADRRGRCSMKLGSGISTSRPAAASSAKGDAEIEHQPLAATAVEIEVHADLAGTAQGQEGRVVPGVIGPASCVSRYAGRGILCGGKIPRCASG